MTSGPPATAIGSPPRVRGARPWWRCRARRSTDHPRAYGEHGHAASIRWPPSPPDRITPARTGSTRRRDRAPMPGRGSPPRVRGAPDRPVTHTCQARITPARTGSTLIAIAVAVHRITPRVRGALPGDAFRDGSPPRVRGALRPHGHATVRRPDHPRAYGEHPQSWRGPRSTVIGSPPRVRGAPRAPARPRSSDHPRAYGEHWRHGAGEADRSDHPRAYGEHASRPAVPQTTCVRTALHLSA